MSNLVHDGKISKQYFANIFPNPIYWVLDTEVTSPAFMWLNLLAVQPSTFPSLFPPYQIKSESK